MADERRARCRRCAFEAAWPAGQRSRYAGRSPSASTWALKGRRPRSGQNTPISRAQPFPFLAATCRFYYAANGIWLYRHQGRAENAFAAVDTCQYESILLNTLRQPSLLHSWPINSLLLIYASKRNMVPPLFLSRDAEQEFPLAATH